MPSAATSTTASPAPTAAASRKPRTDGVEARSRLLHTALKLFAQKGFAKTSTREIAQAAGTNLAAIAYYWLWKRQNLIGAMLTGKQRLATEALRPASMVRLLIGVVLAVAVAWFIAKGARL